MSADRCSLTFKQENPLEKRKALCERLRNTYPDRVPVIVERAPRTRPEIPEISRKKFLAPSDITVAKFSAEIRRHVKLPPQTAIYLFVNGNVIPQPAAPMAQLYSLYRDEEDGFLYILYSGQEVFG